MRQQHAEVETGRSARVWLVALVALGVAAGGYWYYAVEENNLREEKRQALSAIGELKAAQVAAWRQERLADVRRPTDSPFFRRSLASWSRSGFGAEQRAEWLTRLTLEREYGFADALLLDPDRALVLSTVGDGAFVGAETREAATRAVAGRAPTLTGLYRAQDGRIFLDAVAPVFDDARELVALLVQRSDAEAALFPLVESWPLPSPSAEAYLVQGDVEAVAVASRLKYLPGAPLSKQYDLNETSRPAVQAALGTRGVVSGQDYRGVDVLADVRAVPDSPWFQVAKIDREEMLAEARYRAGATSVVVLSLILLATTATAYVSRLKRAALYRSLYESERNRREAAEEFRITLYSIGDAVIACDNDGRVTRMNRVAEQLTGWSETEARGRPCDEVFRIVDEEGHAAVESPVSRVLRDGAIVGLASHTLLVARDGTERPIGDSGAPIRGEDGTVVGVVLVFSDQTADRAARRALAKQEAQLRLALRAANQGLYDLDVQTGDAEVSPEYARMLGYEPDEFVETNARWRKRLHPDDHEPVSRAYEDYIAGRREEYRVEFRQRTRQGDWKWILSLGKIVEYDAEGRPRRMLGTHTDITARRQAENALRESEHRLRLFVEHAPAAIAMLDRDMRYLAVSRRYLIDYGLPDQDLTGRSHYEVFPEIPERWRAAHRRCLAGTVERAEEDAFERADGRTAWVRWEIRPWLETTGEVGGLVHFSEIVTERKLAEEERRKLEDQLRQAQRMESIGRLAGGVAHDFNNMLQTILGYADLLLEDADPTSPMRADLNEIRTAASRSADLTRQLLAFARKQTISPQVLDLNETIAHLLKMLGRLIGEDIDLLFKPTSTIRPVSIDPSQVDQVLANLVVNARDAIAGVGRITIETGTVEFDEQYCRTHHGFSPGEYVLLAVSDDGCGMDEATKARLFEPFFTTKPPGQGTGLGLATVYGIVTQNRGFIHVYSEPGHGTTIRVYLPCHAAAPAQAPAPRPQVGPETGTETVLFVEDEAALLRLGTKMLEQLGYAVLPAASAAEAVSLVETYAGDIDLLITDVIMPQTSGRDLWQRLTGLRSSLKCLFVSGYTANVIAHQGVLDPGVHFLQKPFSREALAAKVREVLGAA
jgi:two-component system, cell cycle sensor histidine kinase and response regulator CckA